MAQGGVFGRGAPECPLLGGFFPVAEPDDGGGGDSRRKRNLSALARDRGVGVGVGSGGSLRGTRSCLAATIAKAGEGSLLVRSPTSSSCGEILCLVSI